MPQDSTSSENDCNKGGHAVPKKQTNKILQMSTLVEPGSWHHLADALVI